MSRLFIIGNGFDIAHGYKTRYLDFKEWLQNELPSELNSKHHPFIPLYEKDNETIDSRSDDRNPRLMLIKFLLYLFERFDINEQDYGWNDFEEALLFLDIEFFHNAQTEDIITEEDGITQEYLEYLSKRNADNLFSSIQHIPYLFAEWIDSVEINLTQIPFGGIISDALNNGKDQDFFINFNYTETLEQNYCIPPEKVLHIHGYRKRKEPLIIGYENGKKRDITLSTFGSDYIYAQERLHDALGLLEKNSDEIIIENEAFFHRIGEASIDKVYSFGFSFSRIDQPYIREIIRRMRGGTKACWYLDCYDKRKIPSFQSVIRQCGFDGKFMHLEV